MGCERWGPTILCSDSQIVLPSVSNWSHTSLVDVENALDNKLKDNQVLETHLGLEGEYGGDVKQKIPVTILISARNEEEKIHACLDALAEFDQVILIDSQSSDRTCEIATQSGVEVVQFKYDGGWPKKRNWALENLDIRNDWVFLLDADERITPALRDEIDAAIRNDSFDGYYVKWKFLFLGAWMKHAWSHGWMLRLIKKDRGRFEDLGMRGEGGWDAEVHENMIVGGKCGKLKALLDHDNHELDRWISKQNEFSTWNAARRFRQLQEPLPAISWLISRDPVRCRKLLKAVFIRLPFRPSFMFVYLYFLKLGFLDGKAGYFFCKLRAMHELNISAKMFELRDR